VIEHLPNPEKVMEEIRRILRPGGCVYVLTPNAGGLSSRLLKAQWEAAEPDDHVILYQYQTLRRLLEDRGFTRPRGWAVDLNVMELTHLLRRGPRRDELQRQKAQKSRRALIGKVVRSSFLRSVRRGVNRLIRFTLIGDKLIATAIKPKN
jgi:SAM-dependent methyltransferase